MKLLFAHIFLFLLIPAIAPSADASAIPNFAPVSSGIYRGGRPGHSGLEELQALGIKTIVNLENDPAITQEEKQYALSLGMREELIPMSGWGTPTDGQVNQAIALIDKEANWPVFIHCQHGSDRTGVVLGIYRVEKQGWSVAEAWQEMKRYGFSRLEVFMKMYFENRTQGEGEN